jgi:hypothetical protein
MPIFIAALLDGLEWLFSTRLGLWIVQAFAFVGLSFGTQHLIVAPALSQLQTLATSGMGSTTFSGLALQWMGVLNFDKALSMIVSAVTTKYAVTAGRLFLQKRS